MKGSCGGPDPTRRHRRRMIGTSLQTARWPADVHHVGRGARAALLVDRYASAASRRTSRCAARGFQAAWRPECGRGSRTGWRCRACRRTRAPPDRRRARAESSGTVAARAPRGRIPAAVGLRALDLAHPGGLHLAVVDQGLRLVAIDLRPAACPPARGVALQPVRVVELARLAIDPPVAECHLDGLRVRDPATPFWRASATRRPSARARRPARLPLLARANASVGRSLIGSGDMDQIRLGGSGLHVSRVCLEI